MRAQVRNRSGAAAAIVLSLVVAACSKSAESKPVHASAAVAAPLVLLPQDVAVVQSIVGGSGIGLSGPLTPKEQVTLRAQVSGTVAGLRVDRGTHVARGQMIATIHAAGVQSQAAGARAGVAAAQTALAVAQQRLDAANRLHEAGAMSDIDHRNAQATYESAQAQLAAAHAQSASAGEAAGYTSIVAPISGVVSNRKVQEGEAVSPGGELLTVVNSGTLELAGQIAVADAARVRVGQAVTFALDAYPNETFKGRVARIDPMADAGTRRVGVYVELANAKGRIIGGTYARGTIVTGSDAAPHLVIPATAVRDAETAQAHVLIVEQGRIAQRAVTLGNRDDATGNIVVLSGLQAGEQVIVVPTADVKVGAAVSIAAANAKASAAHEE